MFTPGFRIFGLFSLAGLVGAIAYGISTGDTSGDDYFGIIDTEIIKGVLSLGWEGGVGEHLGYVLLVFMAFGALFLGVMLSVFKDADPLYLARQEGVETAPNPDNPANRNFWPVVMAFGLSVMVVGLITHAAIFVIGIILAGVSIMEWTVFAWSERLTADPKLNRQIRSRVMAPIEIPVLGVAMAAIMALGASRIFLAVSEINAVWVGAGIAAIIFLGAIFFVSKPKISKPLVASLLVAGAVGIIAAGIASAAVGSREIHTEEIEQTLETETAEVALDE